MEVVIQQAINQFSGREALIRHLWAVDEDFRDLCRDYALCLDTLTCWSGKTVSQAQKAEYISLRGRLEFKIEMSIRRGQHECE